MTQLAPIQSAFVTGSTGLLGNNLVRLLISRGVQVKALARSSKKAQTQFADLPVQIVEGDMNNVAAFAGQLRGIDVIFHTAAFFRDNFKGGKHWNGCSPRKNEGLRREIFGVLAGVAALLQFFARVYTHLHVGQDVWQADIQGLQQITTGRIRRGDAQATATVFAFHFR